MDRKLLEIFDLRAKIGFVILGLFACAGFFVHFYVFLAQLAIVAIFAAYFYHTGVRRRYELLQYMENLTSDVDGAAKNSMIGFPLPIAIMNKHGKISWYNDMFGDVVGRDVYLFDRKLAEILGVEEEDWRRRSIPPSTSP